LRYPLLPLLVDGERLPSGLAPKAGAPSWRVLAGKEVLRD